MKGPTHLAVSRNNLSLTFIKTLFSQIKMAMDGGTATAARVSCISDLFTGGKYVNRGIYKTHLLYQVKLLICTKSCLLILFWTPPLNKFKKKK